MTIIKNTALAFCLALSLSATGNPAFAEEAATSSESSLNEAISEIEKALIEVKNSDFSAATIHLKAARMASEKITGNEALVKQATASVIQGQIQAKYGDIKQSTAELNKALTFYKSL